MINFDLDKSSFFDFDLKNGNNFTIHQNSDLPILKIYPKITKNFDDLLNILPYAYVTFNMIDYNNQYIILGEEALINLNNKDNDIIDTCNVLNNFSIDYQFNKKYTKKIGFYIGEFIIHFSTFNNNKLIVPIEKQLNIIIVPKQNC
jgi:hypothetical protein